MKRLMIALLFLSASVGFAEDKVVVEHIKPGLHRLYDKQFNIVCYIEQNPSNTDTIACVKLDDQKKTVQADQSQAISDKK